MNFDLSELNNKQFVSFCSFLDTLFDSLDESNSIFVERTKSFLSSAIFVVREFKENRLERFDLASLFDELQLSRLLEIYNILEYNDINNDNMNVLKSYFESIGIDFDGREYHYRIGEGHSQEQHFYILDIVKKLLNILVPSKSFTFEPEIINMIADYREKK